MLNMNNSSNKIQRAFLLQHATGAKFTLFKNDGSAAARRVTAFGKGELSQVPSQDIYDLFIAPLTDDPLLVTKEPFIIDFMGTIGGSLLVKNDALQDMDLKLILKVEAENVNKNEDASNAPLSVYLIHTTLKSVTMFKGNDQALETLKLGGHAACDLLFGDSHLDVLDHKDVVGRLVSIDCAGELDMKVGLVSVQ